MKILFWGICLVVFCLPLYLVRFEIFSIPTTVLEVLIYALFVFWLLDRLIRNTKYEIRATKSLFIPIILILAGVTLATIFSSDIRTSAGIWKGWFIDPLLFFIVVVSVIKNSEQIKKILYSLLLSGTIVSIISLIYLIQGKLDITGRLQAFYNSPNYLAMFLAPALIIGICTTFDVVHIVAIVCLLISIFFTNSFGAWIGIAAAVGFGLFIYLLKSNKKIALIILCSALVIILVLGYLALTQRTSSFEARLIIWQKAMSVYKNNPILGIGPGTLGDYLQPHNIFLAFLLQTGIIGFIGFIWLLILFYKTPLSGAKRTSIVLTMIMTYMLAHGLIDTTYWKNDLSLIFWLIIALCYIISRLSYSRKTSNLPEGIETNQ